MMGWTLQKPPGRSWDGARQKDERQLAWVERGDGHPVTSPWHRLRLRLAREGCSVSIFRDFQASPGWSLKKPALTLKPICCEQEVGPETFQGHTHPWLILWRNHEISVPSFKYHQDARMLQDDLGTCMTYWVDRGLDRKTTLVHKPCFLLKPGWRTASHQVPQILAVVIRAERLWWVSHYYMGRGSQVSLRSNCSWRDCHVELITL